MEPVCSYADVMADGHRGLNGAERTAGPCIQDSGEVLANIRQRRRHLHAQMADILRELEHMCEVEAGILSGTGNRDMS